MLAAGKTHHTKKPSFGHAVMLRMGTPRRVLSDIYQRYAPYVVRKAPADSETIALRKTEWFRAMDKEMTPAKSLKTIREIMHLSMAQLGEKVGVTAQRICDFEMGRRGISKAIAKKLSSLTGLPVDSFI